jgi:hypothetical protein
MTHSQRTELLDTIRQLQELRDRTTHEGEAMAAAAQIQRLLLKHNLSEADVEVHLRSDEDPLGQEEEDIIGKSGKHVKMMPAWISQLMSVVARATLTSSTYLSGRWSHGARGTFYGRLSNVQVARYLFQYLIRAIRDVERQARDEILERWDELPGRAYWSSFKRGVVARISIRLREERQEMEQGSSDCRDVLVARATEAKAYRDECCPHLKTISRGRNVSDYRGWKEGSEAGKRIQLSRGITGTTDRGRMIEG